MRTKLSICLVTCGMLAAPLTSANAAKDIVDTAASVDDFSTLVTAVKAAGLVDTLKSDGPFTVFAPTNDAFANLPKGTLESLLKPKNRKQLTDILTYHVVPGRVLAKDVVKLDSAGTVQGRKVSIQLDHGTVQINNAKVLKTDILTSNGVIHIIDSVLLPPADELGVNPRGMIETVVRQGSRLYNAGHVAACSSLYANSLKTLAADHGAKMSPRVASHIQQTLHQIDDVHCHDTRAWMLRRTLNVAYQSMSPLP